MIDEDWSVLSDMLHKFGEKPEERIGESWSAGGGIYADFVTLVAVPGTKGKLGSRDSLALMERLQAALTEMGQRFKKRGSDLTAGGSDELEERVACKEMGRLVAEVIGRATGTQVRGSNV